MPQAGIDLRVFEVAQLPDEVGLGLMKHAYSEFFYLSKFLPSLYIAEQRDTEPVPQPW